MPLCCCPATQTHAPACALHPTCMPSTSQDHPCMHMHSAHVICKHAVAETVYTACAWLF